MNKIIFFSLLFLSQIYCHAQNIQIEEVKSPVDWVNPLMGTDSNFELSNGNVYPAIALPWGMNFWTPQTAPMGHGFVYEYDKNKIKGFKQTHQPSPWMNDYGQFSIMPTTGKLAFKEEQRESWFSHKTEVVQPNYYKVYLADYDLTTEITPTERAAVFRFTFPKSEQSNIIIDAFDNGSFIKVIKDQNKIVGYTTKNSGGVPDNFKNYFVIEFDKPIEQFSIWNGNEWIKKEELEENHVGAAISFKTNNKEVVHAKVASSFISIKQAEKNLTEIEKRSFDNVRDDGRKIWNDNLGRIMVSGGTPDQIKTFYSCLYRCLLFPRKFYEYNDQNQVIHYSPYNGQVRSGYMFTDTGFWDTFRALFPLLNVLYPEMVGHIQEGHVNAYEEGGWLPEWASPGYRDIMVGNNSASIVSEAYLKSGNSYDYDIEKLYEALLHGANNEGPMRAVGRHGVEFYNELGYIPFDVGVNENVARSLEYAYDDFAIYQLAKALHKPKEEIELYRKRSLNYKNLFDSETNLMRGKDKQGNFRTPFNPFAWGGDFTEGNSWHYTWSVFHDMNGLIQLMGGEKQFNQQLDNVFSLPPIFDETNYGGVIHEIREMQIMGMGQYAHGNQPIQHMAYLYNFSGQPYKSQYWAREIMDKLYNPNPDGYCGDEDNGQTSAWYVFSALGFYPVSPTSSEYVIGSPLFKEVKIQLENGKTLSITTKRDDPKNQYISSIERDGKDYKYNYFGHENLMKGGTIKFEMSDVPNKKRGTNPKYYPFSLSCN